MEMTEEEQRMKFIQIMNEYENATGHFMTKKDVMREMQPRFTIDLEVEYREYMQQS